MALILNDDEQQFGDSVRRFAAERSPLSKLRELMTSGQPYDQDAWKQLSALGLPGLVIPASTGSYSGVSSAPKARYPFSSRAVVPYTPMPTGTSPCGPPTSRSRSHTCPACSVGTCSSQPYSPT